MHSTYVRSMNDKRSYNSKCYVNSSQALWKQNEELIIDNLDLNKELLDFISNAVNDSDEASEYLSLEETQKAYGATELMSAQGNQSQKSHMNFDCHPDAISAKGQASKQSV